MLIFFYLLLFFLWAVLGSFGGVIIERGREWFAWADRKRVFWGRSYCPSCKNTLTRWQLIPLGGWLLQKGKCFRCKLQIPVRYLREEIVMGVVFVITGWVLIWTDLTALVNHTSSLQLLFWLLLNRGLVLLLIADLLRYELNLYVRILLMVIIVWFQLLWFIGDWQMMILGGLILSCLFYGIYAGAAWRQTRKQGEFTEWFGLWDVWMAGLIWALVPVLFASWDVFFWIQLVLLYLIMSSWLGIVFWLFRKQITKNDEEQMPFLPAMIVAFRILTVGGTTILWWMGV